jgi:hypothetical protein
MANDPYPILNQADRRRIGSGLVRRLCDLHRNYEQNVTNLHLR